MKYLNLGFKLRQTRGDNSAIEFIRKTGLKISKQYLSYAESGQTKLAFKHIKQICLSLSLCDAEFKKAYLKDMSVYFDEKMGPN